MPRRQPLLFLWGRDCGVRSRLLDWFAKQPSTAFGHLTFFTIVSSAVTNGLPFHVPRRRHGRGCTYSEVGAVVSLQLGRAGSGHGAGHLVRIAAAAPGSFFHLPPGGRSLRTLSGVWAGSAVHGIVGSSDRPFRVRTALSRHSAQRRSDPAQRVCGDFTAGGKRGAETLAGRTTSRRHARAAGGDR